MADDVGRRQKRWREKRTPQLSAERAPRGLRPGLQFLFWSCISAGMKNPYWSSQGQTHPISIDQIRRLCFDVVNIVAASGELAGDSVADIEPDEVAPSESRIFQLHHELAERELCEKLLRLAVLVRTFDDIASTSVKGDAYTEHAKQTSGKNEVGDLKVAGETVDFNLREACNKIIHAQEIRAVYDDAVRFSGDELVSRRWYCDGEVELKGIQNKKSWQASVYIFDFIETVLERIDFEV